jgi:hypothetical protein
MSDFVIGIPIGMAIGIALGIALGKNKKSWSELTDEEKRIRKMLIGLLSVIFCIGVVVFLWQTLIL